MKQTVISTLLCTCILALFSLAWLPSEVNARAGSGSGGMGWTGASGGKQSPHARRIKHWGNHVKGHQAGSGMAGAADDFGTYGDDDGSGGSGHTAGGAGMDGFSDDDYDYGGSLGLSGA